MNWGRAPTTVITATPSLRMPRPVAAGGDMSSGGVEGAADRLPRQEEERRVGEKHRGGIELDGSTRARAEDVAEDEARRDQPHAGRVGPEHPRLPFENGQ